MEDTERLDRIEKIVYGLATPVEETNFEQPLKDEVQHLGEALFIAEAQRLFEREPENYSTVEEAGVALGDFLGKIERGELILNGYGEYVQGP